MADDDGDGDDGAGGSTSTVPVVHPVSFSKLPGYLFSHYREVGDEATWTLSSAKSGNGAEALRNGDTQTYWQSDGMHPHRITVHFHRRAALMELALHCNHKLDESYTPRHVRVLAGNTDSLEDLELVIEAELDPSGWVLVPLFHAKTRRPLRAFVLQVEIVSMMQNGRDTHVRGVRLFGPRATDAGGGAAAPATPLQYSPNSNNNTSSPASSHRTPTSGAVPSFLDMSVLH